MSKGKELKEEELEKVTGGININGIIYKYEINTVLISRGIQETITATITNYAVIDGCPAYELDATKNFVNESYSESFQATLKESFLDQAGYEPIQ